MGGGTKKFLSKMKKNKVFQNCLKWRENWSKIILEVLSPPPKKNKNIWGRTTILFKNERNQSCSKLPEMARKLVENDFRTF